MIAGPPPPCEENEISESGVCPLEVSTGKRLERRSILVRPERSRPIEQELYWNGLRLARTGGRHSLDPSVEPALGPISGFVLGDLYIASDSVWCDEVAAALALWQPRIAVVNAGAARFLGSGPISMTAADVAEVTARVPVTVAVHLEAMNHCPMTRAELRAAVPDALVLEDGETREL